jgi:hypothetical protein
VTCLVKAERAETEQTANARERLCKRNSTVANSHDRSNTHEGNNGGTSRSGVFNAVRGKSLNLAVIKKGRLTDFQSQCDIDFDFSSLIPRVEAGWNTSTVTLRVVGGDEKGSIKSETVKYGREFKGTRTRKRLRWRGPAGIVNDRPVL